MHFGPRLLQLSCAMGQAIGSREGVGAFLCRPPREVSKKRERGRFLKVLERVERREPIREIEAKYRPGGRGRVDICGT